MTDGGRRASQGRELWTRQWDIYHVAVGLPPADIEEFLEVECAGDDVLREEVRSLLLVEEAGFLERPASTGLAALHDLQAGDEIGPYRIRELLGEGGMGTVYHAEQQAPLRRSVALKVIKAGMDSEAVVRRFSAERQALAVLEHPGIAQVFDAGITAQGRPYFVMERVVGEPIDSYCDRQRLNLDQRLELFCTVCAAVQHAHQKGIVHRDLKPSNILVRKQEGHSDQATVKVIDFGIAKFLGGRAEQTSVTVVGQLVGTLDTMAPEQVDPDSGSIDSRTDVFGLGVVLYQLLAGVSPFASVDQEGSSWSAIETSIRTREAVAPIKRLADSSATEWMSIASARGLGPAQLRRELSGELGWIVLRALRSQPEARYASASELAADIVRFRSLLPVEAGPPSASYRLRKMVRRHRVAAAVAMFLLIVVVGFVLALVGRTMELGRALDRAEVARSTALVQTQRAEAVSGFVVGLLERSNPEESAGVPSVRDALSLGLEQLSADSDLDYETRLELLVTVGRAFSSLGEYASAKESLHQALLAAENQEPESTNHAIVLLDLAILAGRRGDYASAVDGLYRAIAIHRTLGRARSLDAANSLLRLGINLRNLARFDEAEVALKEARSVFLELGSAVSLRRAALPLDALAGVAKDRGNTRQAVELYSAALAARQRDNDPESLSVGVGMNNLGSGHQQHGAYHEAREAYRHAARIFEKLLEADHPRALATAHNIAHVTALLGEPEGEPLLRGALQRRLARLGEDHPDVAGARLSLGEVLLDLGQPRRADPLLRAAVEVLGRRLGSQHPRMGRARAALGGVLVLTGELAMARSEIEAAVETFETIHPEGSLPYSEALRWKGELLRRRGDLDGSEVVLRRALIMARAHQGLDPWPMIRLQGNLAVCLRDQQKEEEAAELGQAAVAAAKSRWPTGNVRLTNFLGSLQRISNFTRS